MNERDELNQMCAGVERLINAIEDQGNLIDAQSRCIEKFAAALRFYATMSDEDYAAALREHVAIGQRARAALEEQE